MSPIDRPNDKAEQSFEQYLNTKHQCRSVTRIRPAVFAVEMDNGSCIATLVNYYLLSESDVLEIMDQDPDVTAIVNSGSWNRYKPEAAKLAAERGVGVFGFKEFMGAVHHLRKTLPPSKPRPGTG